MASGDYIAFIDDDALPEPVWLSDLVEALHFGDVVGVGGLVFGPSGRLLQFKYSSCNRFGISNHKLHEPADDLAFPFSFNFPHFMGTNCMFRRNSLVQIGGFDEEYEYYLDETDLCCRLIDQGFGLRQLERAPVYHKFLSGSVRDAIGIEIATYPMMKNQLYFCLQHSQRHASLHEILLVAQNFKQSYRSNLITHVAAGRLHNAILDQFDADVERAWQVGLRRGLSNVQRKRPVSFFSHPEPFLPFRTNDNIRRAGHLIFLVDKLHEMSELNRRTRELAEQLASEGNIVRILEIMSSKVAEDEDSVEFERQVWKHRLVSTFSQTPLPPGILQLDEQDWGRSVTIRDALNRIASFHKIDLVEDCSERGLSLATVLTGHFDLQLCLSSTQVQNISDHRRISNPLTFVARRAMRVVLINNDDTYNQEHQLQRSEVIYIRIPKSITTQAKIYSRWLMSL
jgi:hypothetical protein